MTWHAVYDVAALAVALLLSAGFVGWVVTSSEPREGAER